MNQKTVFATLYTGKYNAYLQTKFFTLKISNSHVYTTEELYKIENGILYPNANEGTISTTTLLKTQNEKLTEQRDVKLNLLISNAEEKAFVKSYTDNLPYPPYFVTTNDKVYEINRIRKTPVDEFLDDIQDSTNKKLVKNIETGITGLKTNNQIKNSTQILLSFNI